MGKLRSETNHAWLLVNGVTLGQPAYATDDDGNMIAGSDYAWDDARLPNGTIDDAGNITLDEVEDI